MTTLRPWPSGSERATISSDTGEGSRCPAATSASTNTVTPTAVAMTTRSARRIAVDWCSKRSGRRRSTSTNTTVERVSTDAWVSARSGAPDTTNRPAIA